jgi:hypothetical protein
MSTNWLAWSNPVGAWWMLLVAVSTINVGALLWLRDRFRSRTPDWRKRTATIEPLLLLCAVYVLGCAFRSVLPRADVQRICLFDTWLSSVFVGRSVATAAELCFAMQWAIVLYELGRMVDSDIARRIAKAVVPLIAVAEACSWYAVITTNYWGNVLENSLWTATFTLIAVALLRLAISFRGAAQLGIVAAMVGIAGYATFMCAVDVPMYFARWQADAVSGKAFLGLFAGLYDVATRWVVTHDIGQWRQEIAWMSLYFSAAVWTSLLLAGFALVRHRLPRYRVRPLTRKARLPLAVAVRSPPRLP